MENLAILANIAEIVGAIIVVVGLLFAVPQMRQIQQQRRELAAIELFRFSAIPVSPGRSIVCCTCPTN